MSNLTTINRLMSPGVSIPGWALTSAGLNAYGNALSENHLEKGDNRLVAESLLTGTGTALGLGAAYRLKRNPTIQRMAGSIMKASNLPVEVKDTLSKVVPFTVGTAFSGVGAGLGLGTANLVSGQANLMGLPSFSGRQMDYYEEDKKPATDALTPEDIQRLQTMLQGVQI